MITRSSRIASISSPRPRFVSILTIANLAIFALLLMFGVLPSIIRDVPDGYSDLPARLAPLYLILSLTICLGAWQARKGKRYGRNLLLAGLLIFTVVACVAQVTAPRGTSDWSWSVVAGLALIGAWCILNCWLFLFSRPAKTFYG